MDHKLITLALIILLINVEVNSHQLLSRLRNFGHLPLKSLLHPVKRVRCSSRHLTDFLIDNSLLNRLSHTHQKPHEPHYFLKNGIQRVPTRKSMYQPAIGNGNAILNDDKLVYDDPKNLIKAQHNNQPKEKNSLLDRLKKLPKLITESACTNTSASKENSEQIDGNNSTVVPNPLNNTNETCYTKYVKILERFERLFYTTTFNKLKSLAPENRQINGMSFVQSGLFLQLALTALSTEMDNITRHEIENILKWNSCDTEQTDIIRRITSSLPESSEDIKFRWTSRLVLNKDKQLSQEFTDGAASALRLHIDHFNGTETPSQIATVLNEMIERDSGGAIRETFDEDDFADNVTGVLITTLYLRAQWRSPPTLINGTHEFLDSENGPFGTVRMIRINDVVKYTKLHDWKTEAIEIFYKTTGLSLLILVPEERSLQQLTRHASETDIGEIIEKMRPKRVAVTLPLYTLRMTLLLPNKLEAMGVNHIMNASNNTERDYLRISHAVQRLMFWAEAGRNAFKDDGIEWDQTPELEVMINRPYIFYVRWNNITLMNGNFVL